MQPPNQSQPNQPPLSYTQYPQQYQQQPPYYPGPPPPPKRKIRKRTWVFLAIGVFLLIGVINAIVTGGKGVGNTETVTPAPTSASQSTSSAKATARPTSAPVAKPTAKPAPTFVTFGDGTFTVGKDVKPGTYRTRSGSAGCYYARLSGFSGNTSDILANNNTDDPVVVTIAASDKGFESTNCGTWTNDLSQITTSKTSFDNGMYIIGTDIAPGTYKSSAASGCYYARLSGFSNSTDDILANNNTDNGAIVTISASDKGFESTKCGTWTKQ